MRKSRASMAACLSLCFVALPALAQRRAENKFTDAIQRSQSAGRIMASLALVPESGFPKELLDKAQAVGVFPKVERETMMFSQVSMCYGVICARGADGWTPPAFYAFGGGGYGNPFARSETFGVILLFMTKDAVAAFEKGGVKLKGEKKALAGPVGAITDEQRKEIEGAHILAYAYFNGELKGTAFGKSFWKNFALNPDNNINKPLYGVKGREVLAGAKINSSSLPEGITAFQEALQKHFGQGQ